jgi:hypothetical protein
VAYLGCQRQDLGPVVEVVPEPQEPLVCGNRAHASDHDGTGCAMPVAVIAPFLHPSQLFPLLGQSLARRRLRQALRDQVAHEVDNERGYELGHIRLPLLDAAICAERSVDGFKPEPARPGDRVGGFGSFLPYRRLGHMLPANYM